MKFRIGALLVCVSVRIAAQTPLMPPPPVTPSPSPGSKAVLQPQDFVYECYYDVTAMANTAQGLTHHYVNGELRFLTTQTAGQLREFSLAGTSCGQTIATPTRTWADIGGFDVGYDYRGIWMEQAKARLWTVGAQSYTVTHFPTQIYTRTLNDDGTISNLHGPVSLRGIPAKRVFGGAQAVPTWFQQQYGVGPYIVGWGGGTSLILQGGNASIGPTMYGMPDPADSANGATVRAKTIADFATADRYRGARVTLPLNYLDGGDPRPNPPTPPTSPPISSAQWLSPRKDGKGWMTPVDAYWNTMQWIETPTKHGVVAVLSACGGKAYYMLSDINCDFMQFELHIFDPATLGRAAQGRLSPHAVEPASMRELTLPGFGATNKGEMTSSMSVGGATYDPVTGKLYVLAMGINTFEEINRLFVYALAP